MTSMRVTFAILLCVGLCSCGGNKEQGGKVTLTLYHWMENDRRLWEDEIIKPFEQTHPNIHVVLQTSPYSLYVTKSLTSIASGNRLADVMFAEDWFGQELMQKEYALNLMPYAKRDLSLDDFSTETFTEWRGVAQRQNELFGFPACLGLTVLFYNRDLFDRAGLPYPDTSWTYDDLLRVGSRLTIDKDGDGTPEQWGLSFDVHYTGLETVVYSFGGRLLTEDAHRADMRGPETKKAFQYVRSLFVDRKIASNTSSFVNSCDSFVGSRSAMMLIGSVGALNLMGSTIRWDLTYPPRGPDGVRKSRRFTMAFMIPKNSPHPEEAWELLRWILTKSPVEKIHTMYFGMMPTYKPFTRSSAWLDATPLHNRRLLVELEGKYAFPLFTPAWQEWRDNNLTPELLLMIQGQKPVDEFLDNAEQRINGVLGRVFTK
jgi:multiple sugar transport system substrate-binding protein